jgi:hypothetical protein
MHYPLGKSSSKFSRGNTQERGKHPAVVGKVLESHYFSNFRNGLVGSNEIGFGNLNLQLVNVRIDIHPHHFVEVSGNIGAAVVAVVGDILDADFLRHMHFDIGQCMLHENLFLFLFWLSK